MFLIASLWMRLYDTVIYNKKYKFGVHPISVTEAFKTHEIS